MKNYWANFLHDLHQQNVAYVLVTIIGRRGSAPRDSGTKMIVTAEQSFATIGGGQLEFMAVEQARLMLNCDTYADQHLEHYPLGPKLGQCCGGSTNILYEHFAARSPHVMLFGAGHVGRALVNILCDLPMQVAWVDNREDQFPETLKYSNIRQVVSTSPVDAIANMSAGAYYLVMTHDHQLDFDLCCALLERGDADYIGLIGSNTKWLRFQRRLSEAGFSAAQIATINSPVGLSNVTGKQPMEVAVSISGQLIEQYQQTAITTEKQTVKQQGIQWKELKLVSTNRHTETNTDTDDEQAATRSNTDCDTCSACK